MQEVLPRPLIYGVYLTQWPFLILGTLAQPLMYGAHCLRERQWLSGEEYGQSLTQNFDNTSEEEGDSSG